MAVFKERFGVLTRINSSQMKLLGTSLIKLGGQFKVLTDPTLLTSVSGIGGIDNGSLSKNSLYTIYAVFNGTNTGIVASLSSASPTGFTYYSKVGTMFIDGSSNILADYSLEKFNDGNSDYFTGCPIGGGFIWYGLASKIPSNCKICDNTSLVIANYVKLNTSLGGSWGTDGININLPDLRGRFPRGVDSGIGRDTDSVSRTSANAGGNTGDAVGSIQDDLNKKHQHFVFKDVAVNNGTHINSSLYPVSMEVFDQSQDYEIKGSSSEADTGRSSYNGGDESRPKNANVYFVIRVS